MSFKKHRASVAAKPTGKEHRLPSQGNPSVQITVLSSGTPPIEGNKTALKDYATATGQVIYRPRIALPLNAVVEVALADVGRADAPAIVLAPQTVVTEGQQVPIPVELIYSPDHIAPQYSYAVQARIAAEGPLRFIDTLHIAVITRCKPTDIEIAVDLA